METDESSTEENESKQAEDQNNALSAQAKEAQLFIRAFGGKDNILDTDACITRLRMTVRESSHLQDEVFKNLGAKGVIRPDKNSIQVVLGSKAEKISDAIKEQLGG